MSALEAWRTSRDRLPDSVPHPIWPEPGGLLAAAHDDDAEALFFRTIGSDPHAASVPADVS